MPGCKTFRTWLKCYLLVSKKNRPWTQTATNAMFLVNTNLTTPYLAGSMLVAGMAITVPQRVRTSTRCVAFLWSFLSSATICNSRLKDPVKMICRVSSYTVTLVILYILLLNYTAPWSRWFFNLPGVPHFTAGHPLSPRGFVRLGPLRPHGGHDVAMSSLGGERCNGRSAVSWPMVIEIFHRTIKRTLMKYEIDL